jgi:hypothetical protein
MLPRKYVKNMSNGIISETMYFLYRGINDYFLGMVIFILCFLFKRESLIKLASLPKEKV